MPKRKPTHLYKLEDISGNDTLTYQFAFTSGEVGSSEFRNLVYKKINELLKERCGNSGIGTRVVLTGRLTYITVLCQHAEARNCIVDGVAAAFTEHTSVQSSEEETLTTLVARDVTALGCQIVTISYTVTEGWAVRPSALGQLVEPPLSCTHDSSTQSVVIRSGNPLYGIDDETIARVVAALTVSAAKVAKTTDTQRLARALGGAALAMPDNLYDISDAQTSGLAGLGGGRFPEIVKEGRMPRLPAPEKHVEKLSVASLIDRLIGADLGSQLRASGDIWSDSSRYYPSYGGGSKYINSY